jgi:hypothetical protein
MGSGEVPIHVYGVELERHRQGMTSEALKRYKTVTLAVSNTSEVLGPGTRIGEGVGGKLAVSNTSEV